MLAALCRLQIDENAEDESDINFFWWTSERGMSGEKSAPPDAKPSNSRKFARSLEEIDPSHRFLNVQAVDKVGNRSRILSEPLPGV